MEENPDTAGSAPAIARLWLWVVRITALVLAIFALTPILARRVSSALGSSDSDSASSFRFQTRAGSDGANNPCTELSAPQGASVTNQEVSTINFYVADKNSQMVSDLTKGEFRVFEDKEEQQIIQFSPELVDPLVLGVLIDVSGSRLDKIAGAERAFANDLFSSLLHEEDTAFIVSFSKAPSLLADFTNDVQVLSTAVNRAFKTEPYGGTALYDCISSVCDGIILRRSGRRVLLIISDADDNSSRMTLSDALRSAQRANATIHMVFVGKYPDTDGLLTTHSGSPWARGAALWMTSKTGGSVFVASTGEEMRQAFRNIAGILRRSYKIGYVPSNCRREGMFRKVQIKVRRKGLRILAPEGYFEPSPQPR
jgi:VWFA-related protein